MGVRDRAAGYSVGRDGPDEGEDAMIGKTMKRTAVLAVAVPLVAAGARRVSQAVEARRGSSRATRLLRRAADLLGRNSHRRRRFW